MIVKTFGIICLLFFLVLYKKSKAQELDYYDFAQTTNKEDDQVYHYTAKKLTIPLVFFSFGALCHTIPPLINLNRNTRDGVERSMSGKIRFDDYSQYLPAGMVYGLNFIGIKGRHNFEDRSLIYSTSTAISGLSVTLMKHALQRSRPDGSNGLSFPSGHTTTAFAAAHFLFREYQDQNKWLSLSGYPFAILTGVCRVLNNKHWVGDVVAGAGLGILSTEASYWLLPNTKKLFKKRVFRGLSLAPSYNYGQLGWAIHKQL